MPLVGRTHERDRLWQRLTDVWTSGRASVIHVTGPAGVGKTRLMRWFVARAHELGAAITYGARHAPTPARFDGLVGMIDRALRTVGMNRFQVGLRLRRMMVERGESEAYWWEALTELLRPAGDEPAVRFSDAHERWAVIRRWLQLWTRERPAIVTVDDAQWGPEALEFVRFVAASSEPCSVLFVVATRDDALARSARANTLLDAIGATVPIEHLRLAPLEPDVHQELVGGMLRLSAPLARQVRERTAGNPQFAVQLVGDWVRRGILRVGDDGLEVAPGTESDVPDDVYAVWRRQITDATDERSGLRALQVAAALGHDIENVEWRAACARAGVTRPETAVESLFGHRLAFPTYGGWRFANPMVRETLERMAREQGWFAELAAAAAAALAELYRPESARDAARRGRLLALAGRDEDALAPLLAAAKGAIGESRFDDAHELLDERDAILERLGRPPSDREVVRTLLARGRAHRLRWEFDPAEDAALRALAHATDGGLAAERAVALAQLAHLARQRGRLAEAEDLARRARELCEQSVELDIVIDVIQLGALVAREQGRLADSGRLYDEARVLCEQLGDAYRTAYCVSGQGHVARTRGDTEAAIGAYEQASRMFSQLGCSHEMANCINGMAELARYHGDLDTAETGYREALRLFDRIGSRSSDVLRLNLGLVQIRRGAFHAAEQELERARVALEASEQKGMLAFAHVFLLSCVIARNDVDAWDTHLARARTLLESTGVTDPDIARLAGLAAEMCEARGYDARADQARAIATGQRQGLHGQ